MNGFDARSPCRHSPAKLRQLAREAFVFWGIGALVLALVTLVRDTAVVLLLTFAGVLFGTALRGAAEWLAPRLGIRIGWSLVVCIAVLLAFFAAAVIWVPCECSTSMMCCADRPASARSLAPGR